MSSPVDDSHESWQRSRRRRPVATRSALPAGRAGSRTRPCLVQPAGQSPERFNEASTNEDLVAASNDVILASVAATHLQPRCRRSPDGFRFTTASSVN